MKGINLRAAEFEVALIQVVNAAELPACMVRMTMEKVLQDVRNAEQAAINQEMVNYKKEEVGEDGGQEDQ